jgi:hypothetical protein
MKTSIAQCRHSLAQIGGILPFLNDEHRAVEPCPGTKTAGWLIGHLAITGDFARRLCGGRPLCPREWRELFKPGTVPSANPNDYPPMTDLCDKLQSVFSDLGDLAAASDPSQLAGPCPHEAARAFYPTAGDFVAYLMSSHFAYHLGQLVTWCAAAGIQRESRSTATFN